MKLFNMIQLTNLRFLLALISSLLIVQVSCIVGIFLRSNHSYITTINDLCPSELKDNYAGKDGLYFNHTDYHIKLSIMKKYFHHCGAWCLFDYRDPRKGWYWNATIRQWEYQNNMFALCPDTEFHYCLDKFFQDKFDL